METISNYLEKIVSYSSAIAVVLLVLSTAYDYSYLTALKLSFNEVPTTLSDHVRSAIIWLPQAIIYVFVFILYEIHMRWVEGGKTEEEIIQKSATLKWRRILRTSIKYLIGANIVFPLIFQFLFTNSLLPVYLVCIVAWAFTAIKVVKHKIFGDSLSSTFKRILIIFPIGVIWVGSIGYLNAEQILSRKLPEWALEINNEKVESPMSVLGMRRFENVAIVVNDRKDIFVIPDNWIISSKKLNNSENNDVRICRWLGMFCNDHEK